MFKFCTYNETEKHELDTSKGILEVLSESRVFKVKQEKNNKFSIQELCDREFAVSVSREELKQLGEEIIKLAST